MCLTSHEAEGMVVERKGHLVMRPFESIKSQNVMPALQKVFDILNFSLFGTCGTFTDSEYNHCMN